ncbi:tyrosine-type recombinase/integrase [Ramlibacter albus]|uniref:tyrosine-type recombinase/integrase n=1 Tax=Ramlibacter albus TaxID=2079448 RepID=UPI00164D0CB9
MAVIACLDQHYVNTQLACPPGKSRTEVVDPHKTGLYIEVRAASPGQGTFYVRWKDASGKTCHHKLGRTADLTLEAARAAALAHKAATKAPTAARPGVALPGNPPAPLMATNGLMGTPTTVAGGMSLDTFMTEHYFPHVKLHKRSWLRDEQTYKRIKPKFGNLPLAGITRRSVQQFQAELAAQGLAPATVNHHPVLLRRVLNLAMSWEMVDRNVLARIPLLRLDNQVEHYLDDEQVARLVKVLETDKNRMVCLILMFLLATGARLNEGLRAQWKHFDLDGGTWKIPATNSKSRKIMHKPLNASALWVLQQLDTKDESELLFPSPASGKPFTTITRQWYRIRKKAKLPENIRIHDLRHTFASRVVSSGGTLYQVQTLLGHADTRTSQRYAHLSMKAAQEASNLAAFAVG